jgi:hypothetical protein
MKFTQTPALPPEATIAAAALGAVESGGRDARRPAHYETPRWSRRSVEFVFPRLDARLWQGATKIFPMKYIIVGLLALALLVVSGCASGPARSHDAPASSGHSGHRH